MYAFEEQRAGFERDARLRQLDGVDAQTLQQKIAVEQQKAAIEIEYLEKVHEVKQTLYDMDTRRMLLEEELNLKRLGYKADEIRARIAELTQQRQDIRDQGDEANDAAIEAARENAANRTAQMVREHNRQIFDSLKQQAGGVFDALLAEVAVGVEGHRQLAQDRAPDGDQGGGHVARRGHADVDVHRPVGDVRGRRRGAWR